MGKIILLINFGLCCVSVICGARDVINNDLDELNVKNLDRHEISQKYDVFHQFYLRTVEDELKFEFHENLEQNSSKCMSDISYTLQNIRSPWALKLIDSYGKPESGILKGNIRWIGDYNECVDTRVSNPNSATVGNFRGKYCSLTWSLKLPNVSKPLNFVSGVCIPDSCTAEEFQQYAFQLLLERIPVLTSLTSTLKIAEMKCKPTERHLNAGAKAMIALLSIFFTLSLLGSSITVVKYLMEAIQEPKEPSLVNNQFHGDANSKLQNHGLNLDENFQEDVERNTMKVSRLKNFETFLECFCMFRNGAKLLNTSSTEGELLCIHGIRFLSMSWIILAHSYAFVYGHIKNMLEVATFMDNFAFQAVPQAFLAVDSFFVLSGFLLTFLTLKEFSKPKSKISWPHFYIHRYIRLTPLYMVVLGFSATVYLYLGSGPFWPDGDYDEACRKVWWRNLLYINNFDVEAGQCLSWSWYLANDMQFFIISPLFLITLWRWPKIGYSLLAVFLLASCLCNFIITYHFDLSNRMISFLNEGLDMEEIGKRYAEYFSKVYVKPYTRIAPYLIGVFTAYAVFQRKTNNAPKHSMVFLTVGWIVACTITLPIVYGLYHNYPGLVARSFYYALSHVCYAAGLSWVIYVCLVGQGGLVNKLLTFKFYIPLSRLTYAAYLIHPLIINGYVQSLRSTLEFSHPTIVLLFLGFLIVTYAVSIPVALIFESPIVMIEKLVRKKSMAERKTETVN